MKILAIILLVLVGTLILNGPIQSYADPQLDILVNIATKARDNLDVNISQITNVSDEINYSFKQGSEETYALTKAVKAGNNTSARQHFLSAMKFFKTTNDKINSLNGTEVNDPQQVLILRLQSEIARLEKIGKTLRTITITNHADLNFTQFDQTIKNAKQDLDTGKVDEVSKLIDTANKLMIDAHHSLAGIAKQRSTDRAKDFTEKQIETLNKTGNLNISKIPVTEVPGIASTPNTSNNMTYGQNPMEMIAKIRKLISEGNVDDALQLIKSLKEYEKQNLTTQGALDHSQSLDNNTNIGNQTTNDNFIGVTPPSNVIVDNNLGMNSSNNNVPNQIHNSTEKGNPKSQVKPQGSTDSGQQDSTHKKQNHEEKNLKRLKNEKKKLHNNPQSEDN